MKRSVLLLCAGAALLPALAGGAAAPDTPAAYAWSLPVTVTDDNGVHALRLPSSVYLHAQSAGLADIRLFDRRGLPVPYALREPPTDTYTDARELPLRIFPLYRQPGAPASVTTQGDFKLELRTDSDGRLLSVTSGGPPPRVQQPAQAPALETLILDLGVSARSTPPTVTALRFTPPAGKAGYAAEVWLEASDDLKHWRPLGAADLQWLSATDGAILACDMLAFEPAQFRYARLTWRGGAPAIFAGISALSVSQRHSAPAMDSAVLTPVAGRVPGDLLYAAGVGIPAERAAMQFTTPNAVYAAMLGSYRDPLPAPAAQPAPRARRHHDHDHDDDHHHRLRDRLREHLHRDHRHRSAGPPAPGPAPDPFEPIASATFYDITQGGNRKRSGGLQLAPTRLAQWVVRPYSPQAAAMPLSQAPRLQLSWTPATLLFLANGHGPYTLSYGRAGVPGMEHDVGHIAPGYTDQELRALPKAEAGAARQTRPAGVGGALTAPATGGARDAAGSTANAAGTGVPGTVARPGAPTADAIGGANGGANGGASAGRSASAPRNATLTGKSIDFSDHALLWSILLAGVAGLAYLTVRLLKQPAANGS